MIRAVMEGGLSKAAAARRFNTTPSEGAYRGIPQHRRDDRSLAGGPAAAPLDSRAALKKSPAMFCELRCYLPCACARPAPAGGVEHDRDLATAAMLRAAQSLG